MSQRQQTKKQQWEKKQVQALRRHMGLTQRQLAERLGVRQQTISEWETGMYQPRGASITLLSIVAERAKFGYQAAAQKPQSESDYDSKGRG